MQIDKTTCSGNRRRCIEPLTRVQGDSKDIRTTRPVREPEVLGTKHSLVAGHLARREATPLRWERMVGRLRREPVGTLSDVGRHVDAWYSKIGPSGP